MSNKKTFRSALNGFNREDVVHYIEYLNTQHAAQISQLNAEVEFLRNRLANSAPIPAEEPDPEAKEVVAVEPETDLDTVSRLEAQVQALTAEKAQLEEDLQAALAEKYQAVLDRDAALAQQVTVRSRADEELEAYRRAERAERLAKERAAKVYHRVNGVLADATVQVDDAAVKISGFADEVMAQLSQLQEAVAGSKQALQDAAATMYALQPTEE